MGSIDHISSDSKVQHPKVASSHGGIENYHDYLLEYGEDKRRKTVTEKLEQLQIALKNKFGTDIDPVVYIMELYFGENPISAQGVMENLQGLGIAYTNVNSILSLMRKTFGWTLREGTERIESTVEKRTECEDRGREKLSACAQEVVDTTNKRAHGIIATIIGEKTSTQEKIAGFSPAILRQKESKILGKVFYILETFRGISFNDVVLIYNSGVSVHLIVKNLQKILDAICTEQNLGPSFTIHTTGIVYRLKEAGVYRGNRRVIKK